MGWSHSRQEWPSMKRLIANRRRLTLVVVACVFLNANYGHAQLYKWVDENGKTQYSDTIPPANTDRARIELRSDGTVKNSTQRAATAEEKRLADLKAVDDAKLKIVQDERDRKDKALLMTYTSLVDFDRVRDRALATLATDIQSLAERETLLGKIIAANGVLPASPAAVVPPAPAAPAVAGAPAVPVKAAPVKPASVVLLEAKSELPRIGDSIARKKRELETTTAQYAADRSRLAGLIDAETAKLKASANPALPVSPASAPPSALPAAPVLVKPKK
jgi:hypothetical protein